MRRRFVPKILHVEDDTLLQRALSRHASLVGLQTHAVWTVEEALAACDEPHLWCGFVVDQMLPRRHRSDTPAPHGLDLLSQLAERYPPVPRLLMTGVFEQNLTIRCAALDTTFLHKSFIGGGEASISPFLDRAATLASGIRWPDLASLVRAISATQREEEVLRAYLSHPCSKNDLARTLGIRRATVKAHIRSILSKSQATSMRELAVAVLSPPIAEEASVRVSL